MSPAPPASDDAGTDEPGDPTALPAAVESVVESVVEAAQTSPSRLQPSWLWIFALAILAAGLALSWANFLDRNWFSRSGCLVVVLGIWSGLGGVLTDRVFVRTYEIRRRLLTSRVRARYRHAPDEREREIAELEQRLQERLERHRTAHRLSVGVLEAALLLVGTLVWGFGDLIRFVL